MLEVRRIFKEYEGQPLLKGLSFRVQKSETVCLLGPSGSGKSTLLRIIAGLESAGSGEILWNGKNIARIPVHLRNFGLMFQDYALFPHKNVFENVAFGLRMQDLPREKIKLQVERALAQVELGAFSGRKVTDLSGGEQQRVAFARALAPRPRLLMLDEPLGALDRTLKEQMLAELRKLLQETGIPAIYVTHDQEEAFSIADRLLIMHDGRIVQQGRAERIMNAPANAWVARFLGLGNLIAGEIASRDGRTVQTAIGAFRIESAPRQALRQGTSVTLLILPTAATLIDQPRKQNCITARVKDAYFQGSGYRVQVEAGGSNGFDFVLPQPVRRGQRIHLAIDPRKSKCLCT